MDRGKISVVQPDIGRVGGLTEAKRVCKLAQERGLTIVPHLWKSGISIAAAAHLAATTANCAYIEFLPQELCESALRRELVSDELRMIDGTIPLPQRPGLGIELNRAALNQFEREAGRAAPKTEDDLSRRTTFREERRQREVRLGERGSRPVGITYLCSRLSICIWATPFVAA